MINTLTKRSFQNNRRRNLVAVLAIILTTMMFTALFTLAQSMEKNMTLMYLRQAGTMADASTKQITEEQIKVISEHPEVVSYGWSMVLGLAENQSLAGRQVEIRYGSDQYARNCFAYPVTGKMPENKNEIALDELTIERLGIPMELGQEITLEWRKDRNSPEITSSSFTLCGWWEGNLSVYASMAWVSEEFAREMCGNVEVPADGQILGLCMMGITFSDHENIEGKTAAVLQDCGFGEIDFSPNMTYTPEVKRSIFMENIPMYGGMALVFLAGYLIIFNVFQISVASDIQFYGKLKTLGMTKKQLKKLVYGQSNRLSLTGIPIGLVAGYFLGVLLVPVLISVEEVKTQVSANPVIFAGAALFSYITVIISCLLPARLAGKVSPMEALRYTDTDAGVRKKSKKGKKGASLHRMAWENLWRNRKRTVMVVCSLTLGLVLMSYFYAKNASFDVEKYLMDLTVADYEIDDATNNLEDGYDPSSQTISGELVREIEGMGAVEATGRLYSRQEELVLSEETKNNLTSYYNEERLENYASYDPSFPAWKKGYDLALSGSKSPYTIYGADGIVLNAAVSSIYMLEGAFDAEKFAEGGYCLAIGPGIGSTYSVGEKVWIAGREFEVMAVVKSLYPMVSGRDSVAYDLPLILPAGTFQEIWPDSNLRKYYFDVTDESMEEAGELLEEYQQNHAPGMNIVSRQSMVRQYEAETHSSAVMGYAISFIIALVGILNFVNSMVTAIISRKREFAMIQSIGMTKRQLRQMLVFEGGYYAAMTLAASCIFSALAVGVIVRGMAADGFSTFHFTLFPLGLCSPVLLFFAVLIPYFCFKNLEKQSIVERLRATD